MSEITTSSAKTESAQPQATAWSVEQLNLQIKQLLEGQIATVWVKGELSNFKAHTSGHFYFSLKDKKSQISAVMFRGHNSRLKFKPADGLEVLVRGRVTVYEPRGNYQIVCDMMEPVGAGALQKAFEQLKAKLKEEGLFEAARKRALPAFPRHVAVVTSPTGAAIRDILNIMNRRAPMVRVTVIPTIVQGEGSGAQVLLALQRAWKLVGVDAIIVGRGGGSIEDMWGFNDEALARAIAASPIPVISAVGHEIDFTIADFVADVRAPTPSAAAELVAKSAHELGNRVTQLTRVLTVAMELKLRTLKQKSNGLEQRLVDPRKRLTDLRLRNDDLFDRLTLAVENYLKDRKYKVELNARKLPAPSNLISQKRRRVELALVNMKNSVSKLIEARKAKTQTAMSLLDSLSPLKVLDRGYAIVKKSDDVIRSVAQVKAGDKVALQFADGTAEAQVTNINRV